VIEPLVMRDKDEHGGCQVDSVTTKIVTQVRQARELRELIEAWNSFCPATSTRPSPSTGSDSEPTAAKPGS
jgi:hypothetical protein